MGAPAAQRGTHGMARGLMKAASDISIAELLEGRHLGYAPCVASEGDGERAINIGSLPGGGNNHFPPTILVAIGHDGAGGGSAPSLDSLPKGKDIHYLGGAARACP